MLGLCSRLRGSGTVGGCGSPWVKGSPGASLWHYCKPRVLNKAMGVLWGTYRLFRWVHGGIGLLWLEERIVSRREAGIHCGGLDITL